MTRPERPQTKYAPLFDLLVDYDQETVQLSFEAVEDRLGFELPRSARKHQAWWSNGGHSHAEAWLRAGWRMEGLDLQAGLVTFVRDAPTMMAPLNAPARSKGILPQDGLREYRPVQHVADWLAFVTNASEVQLDVMWDAQGGPARFYPERKSELWGKQTPHRYGHGPFCEFGVLLPPPGPGVYAFLDENRPLYIGETHDFGSRINTGYGHISPRNCYPGGQETNCRINQLMLAALERGADLRLLLLQTDDPWSLELRLISELRPPWNLAIRK